MVSHTEILQKIEDVIAVLRPRIQADGGDVEVVKFESGIVYIRLLGACVHCPVSSMTVSFGLETALKEAIPAVTGVEVID